jgi:hypothetical protein
MVHNAGCNTIPETYRMSVMIQLVKAVVNPNRLMWKMGPDTGIFHNFVACTLQWNKYHSYWSHVYTGMTASAIWSLGLDILFADEVPFRLSGMVKHNNCHYWMNENPGWLEETPNQNDPKVSVCCDIYGTVFLDHTLFSCLCKYRNMSCNVEWSLGALLIWFATCNTTVLLVLAHPHFALNTEKEIG